jgi:hypothetical protein
MTEPDTSARRPALSRWMEWGGRSILTGVLVVLAVIGLLASTAAFWARTVVFEEDRWISTVRDLPKQHDISVALADYLTEALFVAIDFEARVEDALPEDVAVIVPLLTNAIQGFVADEVATFIESDEFERFWVTANRHAHRLIVAVLEDHSTFPGLERTDDTVRLNLIPAINALLDQVGDVAGEVVGTDLSLPEIPDDEATKESIRELSARLGVNLPDDFGQITVYEGDKLPQPRDTVVLIERLRILTVVATVIFSVLAIVVSPSRRRTIMGLLFASAVVFAAALAVPGVISAAVGDLIAQSRDRAAAEEAVHVVFASYMSLYRWLVATALFSGAMVFLTGSGRVARRSRLEMRKVADRFAFTIEVRRFFRRHLVQLRIGGPVVGIVVVALFTRRSLTAVFVLFALVVAWESLLSLVPRTPARRLKPE